VDVTLVLTHDCNLGCSYCYAGKKFRKAMTDEVGRAGIDLAIATTAEDGALDLSFFGGEPLLAWEALVSFSRYATARAAEKGLRLRQSVTTNGTLLDRARVDALAELGVYVALSLDGTKDANDLQRPLMSGKSSYDDTLRALELLVEAGRPFQVISVVTPASAKYFAASVEDLFARGVPRVVINPCYEAVWTDEDLATWEGEFVKALTTVAGEFRRGRVVSFGPFDNKIITRKKGKLGPEDACSLGEKFFAVAPSGNLYPCERMVGEDDHHEHVIGHVDRGLDAVNAKAVRAHMPDYHATNDECGDCAEKQSCGAHCACANIAETGKPGVAGGVQCWYERTTLTLGDVFMRAMIEEQNEPFLRWFFPEGAPLLPEPIAAAVVPRDGKRHLAVM
jgi:uncharacterized protein